MTIKPDRGWRCNERMEQYYAQRANSVCNAILLAGALIYGTVSFAYGLFPLDPGTLRFLKHQYELLHLSGRQSGQGVSPATRRWIEDGCLPAQTHGLKGSENLPLELLLDSRD